MIKIMKKRWAMKIGQAVGLLMLAGCSDFSYCVQCIRGQLDVTSRTRPIDEVLHDPQVPEGERKQLAKVLAIRAFAVDQLALPDNDSYRLYANIGRPYVVWNVVATPEFSLAPKQWCYPVVGCVSYRGYFNPDETRKVGEELASQGFDTDVYGVKAYSTLSWFADPVLNTFLDGADSQLASLIFHELAHQVVYVSDDSSFNEAFAKTVEMEGMRRWLHGNSTGKEWQDYLDREVRGEEFLALLSQTRDQLSGLYAQSLNDEAKRSAKREILAKLEDDLRNRRDTWPNPAAIDSWLERGLNNARLASIATYREHVPAFQALLDAQNNDLPAFYAEVGRLAKLPTAERIARLKKYGEIKVAAVSAEGTSEPHK